MGKKLLFIGIFSIFSFATNAQIGIGASTNPRTLEPYFFGFNGANTIRADSGWAAEPIKKTLQFALPGNMRYPAGSISNFWDWRYGWFLDTLPANMDVPFDQNLLNSPTPCKISDYARSIGGKGPQMVYNLNVLTSNLPYQIGGVAYANSLGLSLAGIEFGNEFYNGFTKNPEHTVAFPTPQIYGDSCNKWADVMVQYFPFKKISVVGLETPGETDKPDYARKAAWLSGVLGKIQSNPNIDAVTLHLYTGSGMAEALAECDSVNLQKMLTQPFKNRDVLAPVFDQIVGAGKNMWITEYNISGKELEMYGTWAHGLFTAAQTLTYLERQEFEIIDCHDMFGDALSSAYFKDTSGFEPINLSLNSTPNELTAVGNTLTLVSRTLEGSKDSERLKFTGLQTDTLFFQNGAIFPLIYGFAFNQDANSDGRKQILMMNLSKKTVPINLGIFNAKLGALDSIDYEMLQGDPLSYIIGNADTVNFSEEDVCGSVFSSRPNKYLGTLLAGTTINLKPYSITYLGGTYDEPSLLIDKSVICGNNAQTVIAYGQPPLQLVCTDNSDVTIVPVLGSDNIFTVTYNGDYGGGDLMPATLQLTDGAANTEVSGINFRRRPEVEIKINGSNTDRIQSICNFPAQIEAKVLVGNATKFVWSPNEGIKEPLVQDTYLESQKEREKSYLVQASDGACWSLPDTVTIIKLANANAGKDRNECTNTEITLSSIESPSTNATYEWINLTTNATIGTDTIATFFTSTTAETTNYQLSVTEEGCTNTDVTAVKTAICCNTGAYVLNPGQSITDLVNAMYSNNDTALYDVEEIGQTTITKFYPSNIIIQFNGDILVDRNTTFFGYPNLRFAENAKLLVENGSYLVLNRCTLDVCTQGKFADGVFASSCQTDLTIYNCEIKHFLNGVVGRYNAPVAVANTVFDDNYTGVQLQNYSQEFPFLPTVIKDQSDTVIVETFWGIQNNDFSADSIYKNITKGILSVNNTKLILGDSSSNKFNHLNAGIYSVNSSLKVNDTKFGERLMLDTAIYCFASTTINPTNQYTLSVGSVAAPDTFSFITNAIYTSGMGAIKINHNYFNNIKQHCLYSIYAQDSIIVNDNVANLFDHFVTIVEPTVSFYPIEIKRDSIFTDTYDETIPAPDWPFGGHPPPYHPTRIAISITSTEFNLRPVTIDDNYIRSRTGIYASKMNDVNCEYNLIELNRQTYSNIGYESYGMRLESCFAPKLYINTIRKYNSILWSNRLTGFGLNNCGNAEMECNKLEYLRRPMYFAGSCLNQKFYNDTINSCGGGLVFSNAFVSAFGGNTSLIPSTGNVFSNFNSTTLRAEGTFGNGANVNYYFRDDDDAKFKPIPNSISLLIPIATDQIRDECENAPPKSADNILNEIATLVEEINDSVYDSGAAYDFSAEVNYYAQQSLYNQIINYSIDYTEHSDEAELVGAFVESVSETSIGIENEVFQLLSEGNAEGALAVAANLPDSSIYEKNILFVTNIILQIATDTLYKISNRDSISLYELAYTHSLIGGPAVFTARNLMQLVVEEFINGTTKSLNGERDLITESIQKLLLSPNPASQKVGIIGLCDDELRYKIEVYNLQNQLVLTKITNCQSNFEVNNLSNGLYLYKILNNTKLQGYGKIQILK